MSMRTGTPRTTAASMACASLLVLVTAAPARAQAEAAPPAGPVPRLANGRPDFSGIWQRPYSPDITEMRRNHTPPEGGELPFTPEGLADWTSYDPVEGDYTGNCFPFGLSRSVNGPFPMRLIQNDTHLVFLYEIGNWFVVVPLDGRDHPEAVEPTWYGHSVGRWEGDKLIIDTVGFNGFTRLDTAGHPHSDALHLIETYELIDAEQIKYSMTVDDPKMYTRPWTIEKIFTPFEGGELMEYVCNENNRALWEGRIKPWIPPWRDPQ